MRFRAWFRPPRHLFALFLASTLAPAAALVWLGWRMLDLDRSLARQQVRDRLERAADVIAATLEREIDALEERLPALLAAPPDSFEKQGAVVAALTPAGIEANAGARLLYVPARPARIEPPAALWTKGEIREFQHNDYDGAAAAFRTLIRSDDRSVQAGALVRLARNLRKSHQPDEALEAYTALQRLGDVQVGGEPAALVAQQARCSLLAELGRRPDLEREAGLLVADLQQGRWQVDRDTFFFHLQQARQWLSTSARPADWQDRLALAAAVQTLWRDWHLNRTQRPNRGRHSDWIDDRGVLLVWRASADRLLVFAAGADYIASEWGRAWVDQRAAITLIDGDGHRVVARSGAGNGPEALRAGPDVGLPWTVRVASADPDQELALLAGRRQLLLAGVGLLAFLILASSYFVVRAVQRELAVARLQSDFVAAVSHEFRTPLTSMRHLVDLLRTGRTTDDGRRRRYYDALAHETERLYRFVETLLDFGRMEAGAERYQFEHVDAAGLVSGIVDDFRRELVASPHQIVLSPNGELPPLRADRDAFGRALWNLLDNAAKYSPAAAPIHVSLGQEAGRIAISVRDEGSGVAPADRDRIFQKFVRGAGAREAGIKGTGVGLAMVDHIVRAHGGEIRLESELGAGSTFTMLLPAGERIA